MTLRSDYYDNPTTGLQAQLADAFTNGGAFVVANQATLSSALTTAASQGKTSFTVTIATTFKPTALRLKGLLLDAYLDGIMAALYDQGLYSFECAPSLNTSDVTITSIDFVFTFQVA
jgi:hypothetical protein